MSVERQLDRIERKVEHLHDVAHAILDAIASEDQDRDKIAQMTKDLKQSAADLNKVVDPNPVPKGP